ncbi:interleukin-8-like [Heptranchias perlo]|uniref:interleukin-8-like n=1 Tax=Heptranchias perlo TaxID=212740 RepID=UPI0035594601
MNCRVGATILVLLGLCAAFTEAAPVDEDEISRCQCIEKEARKMIINSISEIEIIRTNPSCSHTEVIAILKKGHKVCLDTKAPWVKEFVDQLLKPPPFQQ